jgi:hypothetical protein
MMSSLAKDFLLKRRVRFSHDELVDRILCRTEELLATVEDPAEGYHMLKKRAESATSASRNQEARSLG